MPFNSEINLIIQGCFLVIIIGVVYNLIISTRTYGGIIGKSIRLLGIGMLFFSIAMIERSLVNFSVIQLTLVTELLQDILNLLGLVFLGLGFSKLASGSKV